MPIALLRFAIPLVLAVLLAVVIYRYATRRLELKDNKDERRHKRRLERDRRDYDALIEFAETDELEQELRKERQVERNREHDTER